MSAQAVAEQDVWADENRAAASTSHLVLIPSYNTGAKLFETVAAALSQWRPVWVVIDGSTDGTGEALAERARDPSLRVLCRAENGGKGAAVLDGLRAAEAVGFTHILVMDADGQHPVSLIGRFMALSSSRCSMIRRRAFGSLGGRFRTRWRGSRAWAEFATLCSDSASIRSHLSGERWRQAASCAVSISMSKPRYAFAGTACR
jgi:glycosyltransferase involved in cell wall biosynthesis